MDLTQHHSFQLQLCSSMSHPRNLVAIFSLLFLFISEWGGSSALSRHRRTVGGEEATPHEFPWAVYVRKNGALQKSGVIISDSWVLTTWDWTASGTPIYSVTAGGHRIDWPEGTEQSRVVVEVLTHERHSSPVNGANDIVLMRVDRPFEFNQYVQPATLPEQGFNFTDIAVAAGFGYNDEFEIDAINKVEVPHVSTATCQGFYSNSIQPGQICYGGQGKGACDVDFGGPLMCGSNRTLCGLISSSHRSRCETPMLGHPGIYTDVSYYIDWIRNKTHLYQEDPLPVSFVTSCGGYVEATSGIIALQDLAPSQTCVYTVKSQSLNVRVRLAQSTLTNDDLVLVSKIVDGQPTSPVIQTRITQLGQNYTQEGGLFLITIRASDNSSIIAKSLRLEFFTSGFTSRKVIDGHRAADTSRPGSVAYPGNGVAYGADEYALITLSPSGPAGHAGNLTINFTLMDIYDPTTNNCLLARLVLFTLQDGRLVENPRRICGTSLPQPISVPEGVAVFTFIGAYVAQPHYGFAVSY